MSVVPVPPCPTPQATNTNQRRSARRMIPKTNQNLCRPMAWSNRLASLRSHPGASLGVSLNQRGPCSRYLTGQDRGSRRRDRNNRTDSRLSLECSGLTRFASRRRISLPTRMEVGSTHSASSTRARPGSRPPSSPGPPKRMIASVQEPVPAGAGLAPAFAAARARLGLVALLFAVAGIGWWWTVDQMRNMDNGPWTGLGTLGWFLGVWIVMMAAMMFPSVSPTVALYSHMTRQRSRLSPLLFTSGYLLTWAGVGVVAFAIAAGWSGIAGNVLAWDRAGRWVAGVTLVVAAVYELTPLKEACLG